METHVMVVAPFGQVYSSKQHRFNCVEVMAVIRELMATSDSEFVYANRERIIIWQKRPLLASTPGVVADMQYTFFRGEDTASCTCVQVALDAAADIVRIQPGRAWPGAQEYLLSI